MATILLAGIAHPASATERGNPAEALADPGDQGSTRTLYLSLIRQARVDGRSRAALAYLDDFDRQYPRDREALVLRINCLLDLGQTDEARTALKRIPPNDRDGQVLEIRGHVSAALGDWAQAARDYGAALDASPANPLVGNALGYARLRSGQPQQAVEALKAAHDLAPNETVIRNNLALALTVAGRGAEAEALLSAVRDVRSRGEIRSQIASEAARLAVPAAAGAGNETGGDHG
ncbi:tetratricopeptide repeat protein [Novosphingobium sp. PhB165]|uniref:tetratricopeptide repeat protein n=1 Tax=Novosphingobium sp. PhB165 TaxID=2485105 RepID=UPI001FB567EB|nr:tetratricopeptide repeat protein [Novosphingobium sp. PhB165]